MTTYPTVAALTSPARRRRAVTLDSHVAIVLAQQDSPQVTDTRAASTEPVDPIQSEVTAIPSQPVHIYPKKAMELLRKKCPAIRTYADGSNVIRFSSALKSGFNRTLAPFEGGVDDAMQACGHALDFDQARFDQDIVNGCQSGSAPYTCAAAKDDGSTLCPAGGCVLPDGEIATTPLDLLTWECNLKEVPQTVIVRSVLSSEFRTAPIRTNGQLFVYDHGVFNELDEEALIGKIMPHLGAKGTLAKAKQLAALMQMMHVQQVNDFAPSPDFIAFSNGTLDVTRQELGHHSPVHRLANRINQAYSASETCPGFMAFLDQIFSGDPDIEEKKTFLQQWFGYSLVADTSQQKMVIFKGAGANGKSVLMKLAAEMIGWDNMESAMLSRLGVPHVRASMAGKLLVQSADLPKRGIGADGEFKAFVTGDLIEVSPKYKPSYQIRPYVRLMVATNNLPENRDTSDGYFRRLVIIELNRQFSIAERDPHLVTSLLKEIPGIVAWAVQGLYDLRARGQFTIPASSNDAVRLYEEDISPVRLFAAECLEPSVNRSGWSSKDLYMGFRSWCRDRGFDSGNVATLGRELAGLGFDQRKSGTTIWLVNVKDGHRGYFNPAQVINVQTVQALPTPEVTA